MEDLQQQITLDLTARFLADREAGRAREVAEYVALFPGHAELVAHEIERLMATDETATSGGSTAGGGLRAIAHYRVLSELGRGGQGVVYLAEDTRLGRRVALKVLLEGGLARDALARFRREAEIASGLDDRGICPVYDVGIDAGLPYIAMRYVEGESLAQRIAGARAVAKTLTTLVLDETETTTVQPTAPSSAPDTRDRILEVVELIQSVATTVDVAHASGVVHRDLKPGNIMISLTGEPVVLDFGLAGVERDEGDVLTHPGQVMGTPAYMAPEQVAGRRVDRRADVWALGVILFEALTTVRPFGAPTRDGLQRAILEQPAPNVRDLNSRVDRDLATVVAVALEKDPNHRYQTAADLAEDLRRVAELEPIRARPAGLATRVWRWSRRSPELAALAIVVALALPIISALLVNYFDSQPRLRAQREATRRAMIEEHLARGMAHTLTGQLPVATAELEQALALDRDLPEAVAGLALASLGAERPDEALERLALRPELETRHPELRRLRALALRRLGRGDDAAAVEREVDAPHDPLGWYLAGAVTLEDGGDPRRALACFERAAMTAPYRRALYHHAMAAAAAMTGDPVAVERVTAILEETWNDGPAWLWIGFARERLDPEGAAAAFTRATEIAPDLVPAWVGLGQVRVATGDAEGSIAACQRAVDLMPRAGMLRTNLGIALEMAGRLDEALAAHREATRVDPGSARALAELARLFADSGRPAEALEAAQRAVALNPWLAAAHSTLGSAWLQSGDPARALASCEKAVAVGPQDAISRYRHGQVLMALDRTDEAVEAYRLALRLAAGRAPWLAFAQVNLGVALERRGDGDAAASAYEGAIALRPGYARARYNLALIDSRRDRIEQALAGLRQAVASEPDLQPAWGALASMLWDSGRPTETIPAARRAVALADEDATAHCVLGLALDATGAFDEAVIHLRRGHQLGRSRSSWRLPSARWLATGERHAADAGRLDAIVAGEAPRGGDDAYALAQVAERLGKADLALGLYRTAQESGTAALDVRRRIAGLAVAALTRPGRDEARTMLSEELTRCEQLVNGTSSDEQRTRSILIGWRDDAALATVRDPERLALLAADEAAAWRVAWSQLNDLMALFD